MNLGACQDLLLSLAIRSSVLLAVVWLGLLLCKNRSASFRCALLTIGMLGLALLPLTWCLPRIEVSFLPSISQDPTILRAPAVVTENGLDVGDFLISLWLVGIVLMALGQSAGMWQVQRWRDRSQRLDSGYWQGLVHEVSRALGYRGQVRLYRCGSLNSPAAAGLLRPCVFLPAKATSWNAARLRVVLLHEIGHLKRRDLWTQLLSQTVCALYWFHPLVWVLKRSLHQTREFACDHTVLSCGTEPAHYAEHLLALAKNLSRSPAAPRLAMANGLFLAMATAHGRRSSLELRVRAILSFRRSTQLSVLLGCLLFAIGLGTAWATAIFSPAPPLIAWPNSPGSTESTVGHIYDPEEMHLRLMANPFPGNTRLHLRPSPEK